MAQSLYVTIGYIVQVKGLAANHTQQVLPIKCASIDTSSHTACILNWSNRILVIITGAFVAAEIVLDLVWNPLGVVPRTKSVVDDIAIIAAVEEEEGSVSVSGRGGGVEGEQNQRAAQLVETASQDNGARHSESRSQV